MPVCALEFPAAGWVDDGDGVVVEVLVVCNVDVPPVVCACVEVGVGVDVHLVVYELVVLPEVFEPEAETAVVVGVGVVTADVLDVVSVLEVPPLTVGVVLICGLTLMIGSTVITGAEMALEIPLIFME